MDGFRDVTILTAHKEIKKNKTCQILLNITY